MRPLKNEFNLLEVKIDEVIGEISKKLDQKNLKLIYEENLNRITESTNILKFEDIPWPCDGSVQEMIDILLFEVDKTSMKREIRKHQRFWHPDKFYQKMMSRLHPDDKGSFRIRSSNRICFSDKKSN